MSKKLYMRRIMFMLALLFVVSCSDNSTSSAESSSNINKAVTSDKATIAIISHADFLPDRTQIHKGTVIGLPTVLADRMIEHLVNSQRFNPVERTALRKLVMEQRFGKDLTTSYLDRTIDKAIDAMEVVDGHTVAVTGSLADYNDILKDFSDLGSAAGADYVVLGNLEKLKRITQQTEIPYSTTGQTVTKQLNDARLRVRVIDVQSATVLGAATMRAKVSESLFEGQDSDSDDFSIYDDLGQLAGTKVLDIIFPAQIVSIDPFVISRGANDGVKAGDRYLVKREGREILDRSGVVIARLKSDVGRIEVVTPQETVSVVKPLTGSDLKQGDLAFIDAENEAGDVASLVSTVATPVLNKASSQDGASPLPRLAVGLVKSGSTESKNGEVEKNTPIFTDTLISRLTQTKRFQLIDRQEVDQLINEQLAQSIASNRDMPSAMGALKGADYLVYGSLASFSVEEKTTQLPGSSRVIKRKVGHVEGNMRIVDARSGDIMESRKISVAENIDESADGGRKVATLADAFAEEVVKLLMNAVYPIKIAAISTSNTVHINRGDDGGLQVGQMLEVYRPGEPIIDPDTGVKLGMEEAFIGQVTISEVEDARSTGKVTQQREAVAIGDVIKPLLRESKTRDQGIPTLGAIGDKNMGANRNESQEGDNRYTLAVGLVKLSPSARITGFNQGYTKRLTDDLIQKLNKTNRFVVMDRQEVDQVLDEKSFEAIVSGGDIQDRLTELVGADYLIHGEVTNFYTNTERKMVPYLEEEQVRVSGVAEGMFRIIDVHSGAVVAAEKIRYTHDPISGSSDLTKIASDMINAYSTASVGAIVNSLFPIKVLGASGDGNYYLNRGEDAGLRNGLIFDVMREGQEMIDPDTKISFGKSEMKVAVVEVVSVEDYRAVARVVNGNGVNIGDVLRGPHTKKAQHEPKVNKTAW